MGATSVAVSLTTVQTEADITANGSLLPYGFEYETNGSGGLKKYRWIKMKTGVSVGAGLGVATEVVAASITKDSELIVSVANQGRYTIRGFTVAAIGAGGAGWVQFQGEASIECLAATGVGDLLLAAAAGEVSPETAIAIPTVYTVGVALTGGTATTITADLHLD